MNQSNSLIVLHRNDNIAVSCRDLAPGETVRIDDQELLVRQSVPLGHKFARRLVKKGEKILKYGAPIGSAIVDIAAGEHVHLHNMKSEYLPSHTRSGVSQS